MFPILVPLTKTTLTRFKMTILKVTLTLEVIFSLVRLFLKNSLKRFFGRRALDCDALGLIGEGAKGVLVHLGQKPLHSCKRGLHWRKRLLGDHFGQNALRLLFHPLRTTLRNIKVSGPCSRYSGLQA